jgi:DNA-binding LytR/AlgR family response regulator
MKVAICEDEILIAEHLKMIIKSFGYEVVGMVHNKKDMLDLLARSKPDIALVDIRMEGRYDGIEVGEEILTHYNFPVIYITAHSDSEIIQKALKTKPGGYIIKPFKAMDIFTAINIALENFTDTKTHQFIIIKDGYKSVKLFHHEILFLKSDNNYVEIYTHKNRYIERSSLEGMLTDFKADNFIKVHRSYAVNLNHIAEVKANEIMIEDYVIPISRKYISAFRKKFGM